MLRRPAEPAAFIRRYFDKIAPCGLCVFGQPSGLLFNTTQDFPTCCSVQSLIAKRPETRRKGRGRCESCHKKKEKVIQALRDEPSRSSPPIQSRLVEPLYLGLRDILLARIKSGIVTEDMDLWSNHAQRLALNQPSQSTQSEICCDYLKP